MADRNPAGCNNSRIPQAALRRTLNLDPGALDLWEQTLECRQLSARAGQRLLLVARTISDLDSKEQVDAMALAEALTYRSFDLVGVPLPLQV